MTTKIAFMHKAAITHMSSQYFNILLIDQKQVGIYD